MRCTHQSLAISTQAKQQLAAELETIRDEWEEEVDSLENVIEETTCKLDRTILQRDTLKTERDTLRAQLVCSAPNSEQNTEDTESDLAADNGEEHDEEDLGSVRDELASMMSEWSGVQAGWDALEGDNEEDDAESIDDPSELWKNKLAAAESRIVALELELLSAGKPQRCGVCCDPVLNPSEAFTCTCKLHSVHHGKCLDSWARANWSGSCADIPPAQWPLSPGCPVCLEAPRLGRGSVLSSFVPRVSQPVVAEILTRTGPPVSLTEPDGASVVVRDGVATEEETVNTLDFFCCRFLFLL